MPIQSKGPQRLLTIVNNGFELDQFPHEALDASAVELLRTGYQHAQNMLRRSKVPLKLFECVAQLLDLKVSGAPLTIDAFWQLSTAYVGAINSYRFIDATPQWRHQYSTGFQACLGWMRAQGYLVPPLEYQTEVDRPSASIALYVAAFDLRTLNQEKASVWGGWSANNQDGRIVGLPLYPIYRRYGWQYVQRFHKALESHIAGKKARYIPMLRPLVELMGTHQDAHHPDCFQDPNFTTHFWEDFLEYYVTGGLETSSLSTLLSYWNNNGLIFIREGLEASGLFARPSGGMPVAPRRTKPGSATSIKKTEHGVEVKTRLVTHVPLHLTDEEAIQVLFQDIQTDVDRIERWAEEGVAKLTAAVNRRENLATKGQVRFVQEFGANTPGIKDLVSKHNPLALENAAATFLHYGFQTRAELPLSLLYPRPFPQIALELGVPRTGAFLPHLALLVLDHPKITPSFLEKLELFDKKGRLVGLIAVDGADYLVGVKDRAHREQKVRLTERGLHVVRKLIELTEPLREYVKQKGDDVWRYLLLSSGKSFGYPRRSMNLSSWTTDPVHQQELANLISKNQGIDKDSALDLAKRFSLPALRASVGVLIYIKTGSVQEMADALGHAKYDPALLEHYLPTPILRFFRERWIRVFQTGMVVHAMKDSDLLLTASGFETMDQLHAFLKNHTFRSLSEPPGTKCKENKEVEVIFDIHMTVLSLLLNLQRAVLQATHRVNALAVYWATLTAKLVEYIESDLSGREDIRSLLLEARQLNPDESFERVIYE